jgi:hypothetical protein
MHLEWSLAEHEGVCLVALQLTNTGSARRVRVRNRLDGPTWVPRRAGRPEAGWDEDGFEGVLDAGETRPLGYASPGAPREPPAAIVECEATGDDDDGAGPTAAAVLRELGDPRPPRDAVPDAARRSRRRSAPEQPETPPTDGRESSR